jgi:hypothetical protein
MTRSCFVIVVHGDRAPVLLGPMSEDMRAETLRELLSRYQACGLHTLDLNARSPDRVTATVRRYEPRGE